MKRILSFFVILLFLNPIYAQDRTGSIVGTILDAKTRETIPLVNVLVVERPATGASSDENGSFRIDNLDVGTYSLQISAIGFTTRVVTNVVVTTGRASPVTILLEEAVIELEGVTVRASYFNRAQQMSPVSSNVIDRSEVLRSPGGIQDVQRVAQNLPGVASSTDNINELIVRGGAPYENLTIMDHMEIPSINHYSNEFNSAGPINMVNADMIGDVQFSTGGFPANYGDKTSSVMNLTVREGIRSKPFASKTVVNFAGIGALVEGGFANERGSYIASIRNSLLEVLDKIVGLSTLSLTAIPKYWDAQAKIVYDLSPDHKLSINGLYGDSRINVVGDPEEKDELRKNRIDSSSVYSMAPVTKQYAAGVSLRSLWGKNGYSILTVYGSGTKADEEIWEEFAVRSRDAEGKVASSEILNSRIVLTNHSTQSFLGVRADLFHKIGTDHQVSTGAQVLTSHTWNNDVYVAPDTARYDLDGDGSYETGPVITPPWRTVQTIGFADASKYYAYVSDRIQLTPRLAFTLGLRYDHFTYSGRGSLSPRGSISFLLRRPTTVLTVAAGRYTQVHPFPYYDDRQRIGYNRNLENMQADHYVLGVEHVLDIGLKMSIEGYYKSYAKTAVQEDFIRSTESAIDTFWSDRRLTVGDRTVYGIEFFLEQKQVHDIFGTLSISWSSSRMKDPRVPPLVDTYSSEYDYPLLVTAIAGKVVKGARTWLDETPFFIKYPTYILPFSNEMEISVKYRYQTGRPYTPMEYVTWKQQREGGVRWSNGAWVPSDNVNGARYPHYSRLDIQWLSRYYLKNWNINVYVALMNILNRQNVFFQEYRSDGTVETVYQFSFFPVIGVEVEF